MTTLLALLLFSGVELPRIGCWNDAGDARILFGVAGNLIVRNAGEEGCSNTATFSEPNDEGIRTLRIAERWSLAETSAGERYLLYRGTTRFELPQ